MMQCYGYHLDNIAVHILSCCSASAQAFAYADAVHCAWKARLEYMIFCYTDPAWVSLTNERTVDD